MSSILVLYLFSNLTQKRSFRLFCRF